MVNFSQVITFYQFEKNAPDTARLQRGKGMANTFLATGSHCFLNKALILRLYIQIVKKHDDVHLRILNRVIKLKKWPCLFSEI